MQLTNIALATIFVTFLVTSFVRCGESDPARSEPTEPTVAPYPSQQSAQPSALPEPAGEGIVSSQSSMPPTSTLNPQTLKDFKEAVQKRNFRDAWYVYRDANDETRRQCGGHLVNLGDSELVQLIKDISNRTDKKRMLGIVFAHANPELSNTIIDKVKPGVDILRHSVIGNVDLACNTDGFTTVVKRIIDADRQVAATRSGVDVLFWKDKTECIDPMISALQGKASPDPDLANTAIQHAFLHASLYTDHRSPFAKRFHDHRSISAIDYSNALYTAYKNSDSKHELFNWLIERADRDDLNVFISRRRFFNELSSQDQEYANNRYVRIKDDPETRHKKGERLRREKREKVKEVFETLEEEFEGRSLPPVLTNIIINEYGIDETFGN